MHQAIIRVAQPCQESWAAMAPTTAGRHCAACASEVIDFTLKTDAEILAHLAKAAGSRTCGRFAAGQLERPLQRAVPATPTARWRAWLAAAVAVWGLRESVGTEVKAQAPMEMRKMDKAVPEPLRATTRPDYEGTISTPQTIRGIVLDSTTHEGLPGVTVLVKGTNLGCITNADGNFELTVSDDYVHAGVVELRINYLGYVSEERHIVLAAEAPAQKFLLHADIKGLGEVVIAGGISMLSPAPWHPRRFYNWGKYWVTRPFRNW